jgi:hypothetical protein
LRTDGAVVITGTQFLSNTASGAAGGASLNATAQLSGTLFRNNVCTNCAGPGGGAIFAWYPLTLTNALIISNTANGPGGGLAFGLLNPTTSTLYIVNSLFARNSATGAGSAINISTTAQATILHTTIASPTLVSGAAIYVTTGTVFITNTLIASHTVGIARENGTANDAYNLFSKVTTPYSGVVTSSGNSPTGTASFINPALDNYRLNAPGPAINTGVNANITVDLDGIARPQGTGYDIGAFETMVYTLVITNSNSLSGTITSTGGDVSCGVTCTVAFSYGTVVTLTATANTGAAFSAWNGACVSTATTCTITMDADKTVGATFTSGYKVYLPLIQK